MRYFLRNIWKMIPKRERCSFEYFRQQLRKGKVKVDWKAGVVKI